MKCYVCIWVRKCLVAVLSNRIIIGQSWWERGRSRKKEGWSKKGRKEEKEGEEREAKEENERE